MTDGAPTRTMRHLREGEVPFAAGTAVQDDPARPVFRGNGRYDYVCVECGNVLATAMDPDYMTHKVRIRCGRCNTVNVAGGDPAAGTLEPRDAMRGEAAPPQ